MTDQTMIERMARAFAEAFVRADAYIERGDDGLPAYVDEVIDIKAGMRAALTAMREPTEGMKHLYYEKGGPRGEAEYGLEKNHGEFVEAALSALIDAALAER